MKNPAKSIRKFVNSSKFARAKDIFTRAGNIAEGLARWHEHKSIFNALSVAFMLPEELSSILFAPQYSHLILSKEKGWRRPYNHEFENFVAGFLLTFVQEKEGTADSEENISYGKIDNCEFAILYEGKTTSGVYVQEKIKSDFVAAVSKYIWKTVQYKFALIETDKNDNISVKEDLDIFPFPSESATKWKNYIKTCMDAGVNRSFLFFGPPGTGKSCLTRRVAYELDLRTLRIHTTELSDRTIGFTKNILSCLKPDIVILDDFDRVERINSSLLEIIEYIHINTKILMATANNKSALSDAILRPGRFDELVQITRMDEQIVRNILGDIDQKLFDEIKMWPIVYINEYMIRTRFMDKGAAINSLKELRQRIKDCQKYKDSNYDLNDEDVENVKKPHDIFDDLEKIDDEENE